MNFVLKIHGNLMPETGNKIKNIRNDLNPISFLGLVGPNFNEKLNSTFPNEYKSRILQNVYKPQVS